MIKAIETIYNGYRFRSRLEARWAVFFDEMGIKYEWQKILIAYPKNRERALRGEDPNLTDESDNKYEFINRDL